MGRRTGTLAGFLLSAWSLLLPLRAEGSGTLLGSWGGEGAHADLVVRKVAVTPIRAYVGEVIRIEMVWEHRGDISGNYYETTFAEVTANGRVVAGKPFVYDFGARPGDVYRDTFLWDTRGTAPESYRIRGEVPLRLDATPFDNFLVVGDPLLLIPREESFPAGEELGGTGVAENPFPRE